MMSTKDMLDELSFMQSITESIAQRQLNKEVIIRLRDLYNIVCKMGFEPDLLIEQLKATNSL
jgi:hypothetical protein